MSALDPMIRAAQEYAGFPADLPGPPGRHVAVLTCMDARVVTSRLLGLAEGDAHVIRNAGGVLTDDALRSLAMSQRLLGTRSIAVIQHTRCGMSGFDDTGFRDDIETETGERPGWPVVEFDDNVEANVAATIRTLRDCVYLPHRDDVRGFVFDVSTGALTEINA